MSRESRMWCLSSNRTDPQTPADNPFLDLLTKTLRKYGNYDLSSDFISGVCDMSEKKK